MALLGPVQSRDVRKLLFWVSNQVPYICTNCAALPQKMARGLKFRIKEVEGLYYSCIENKGADQLCGYREADQRLGFRIWKKPVFSKFIKGVQMVVCREAGRGRGVENHLYLPIYVYVSCKQPKCPILVLSMYQVVVETIHELCITANSI